MSEEEEAFPLAWQLGKEVDITQKEERRFMKESF